MSKRILLGITGSIAAYKSAELVRLLRKVGDEVRVVMTSAAREFITPMTLQALSGHAVQTGLMDAVSGDAMDHIALARWAEVVVIAPSSADCLAALATGSAQDLLSTVCLATRSPIVVAPAMNQNMWLHPAVQANVQTLRNRNIRIVDPGVGEQACGEVGMGRLADLDAIVAAIKELFSTDGLVGMRVLITAGPTREPIDPVRYLSNRSSGKMGFAVARAAVAAGAEVMLVAGPVTLGTPEGVHRIDVETADEMHRAVTRHVEGCDIVIAAAAVSDYSVAEVSPVKLDKSENKDFTLLLLPTPDILSSITSRDCPPFTVGFAAQTHDCLAYGRAKLLQKRLNMLVVNDVSDKSIGFDSDENACTVLWDGGELAISRMSKASIARQLIELIAKALEMDVGVKGRL